MDREFNYKGYLIKVFDECSGVPFKWVAYDTSDNDESRIFENTFEDILDSIDYRVEQREE